jgi:CDP-diacylglycerol--serine O-phosphatidyltransferase
VKHWRYVVPNAVTSASLALGVLSVESAVRGRPVDAAWWGLYCTLTDKLDGLAANALRATSSFGVQLDSLADLLTFGVVPPTVMFAFFSTRPELGWATGAARVLLSGLCVAYTIATGLRLARFNVAAERGPAAHYTGTPSTMTAGVLLAGFLACLKYSDPAFVAPEALDGWRLLGGLRLDAALRYLPLTLLVGAYGMLSPLRVPRLGRTRHLVTTILLLSAVLFGYSIGLARRLPEYLCAGGLAYLIVCASYHLRTRRG